MTPLTICISSLRERSAMLASLLQSLAAQDRADEVEVLVAVDGRQTDGLQTTTGAKRNQLVAAARGLFVAHVDDDAVSPLYVPMILAAIDRAPSADVVLIRGERIDASKKVWEFTYDVGADWRYCQERRPWAGGGEEPIVRKSPDHLCPVRADVARAVPFEDRRVNEDVEWSRAVAERLRTSARALMV